MPTRRARTARLAAPLTLLLGTFAAVLSGCWTKPPDGAFACERDDDCPGGSRCLPGPEDGKLTCFKSATAPSTPRDGGEPDPCEGEGCEDADVPVPSEAGSAPPDASPPPPAEAGPPPAHDAGPDAGDGGGDAAVDAGPAPDCSARAAEAEEAPCGDCNLGRKKRQRAWSTTTCSWGAWGEYGACQEKAECKPGAVQRGMAEPCGTCNKGTRTPTRTCSATTCKWGAFSEPACDVPKNVCLPMNAGGKGWQCCGMGKWEWCYNRGQEDECTWTGGCETCQGCGC